MTDLLTKLMKISLMIFMGGSLLELGLRLKLREALVGLRNPRFVTQSLLWGFVLCPALAYLLTLVVPLAPPYAMGLLLLAMPPCAPFVPLMVAKARGDLHYAATFMLLAAAGTVLTMPFLVSLLVTGLIVSPWHIAQPLLILVLLPMAIGAVIHSQWATAASLLRPIVRKTTNIATAAMLVLCMVIYEKGFLSAIGSYAIATQAFFFAVVTAGSYWLSFSLPRTQRSVLALGLCTRNLGAALAPLYLASDVDQTAIVMVMLGIPLQVIAASIATRFFAAWSRTAKAGTEA